ncbi:biopolymer transporter ExbD [Halopseudomonas nanhaiensis]|uniref:ExbD/TolR family protein n=1 Tax=Halopseudomonas nanhaiensis TaxID=2830842 RepID=UPI001CC0D14E|nr:biopolymer transporter ExbD [Halopseudomonas nanhaiensis]UAW96968.1 biopolymer transporter ExbD [Halopseudomonas nanhaiensis]
MNFRRQKLDGVEVNLTPLIDVVFLLLIFFMVSTTFTRETQLKIDLPQASSGEAVESTVPQQIEVTISASGETAINDKVLLDPSLDRLKTALERESAGDTSMPVIITADAQTPHQSVITAMDAAGQLGFGRLRLTTSQMEAGGSQ